MIRKIAKMRKFLFVLLSLELVFFLISYAVFSNRNILLLVLYVFIKNVVIGTVLLYIFNVIENNTIGVSEILNDNTDNIFVYGGIGLIKYDEHRNISWTSDIFDELEIKLVGSKVLEWQPKLAPLFDVDDTIVIDVNSRKYEVYNNKSVRMLYLKDVTDFVLVSKDFEDQQICVAYITIDNYEETIERADEQTAALIQTTCRQTLIDWANENGIILRRYKSEGYLAILNERSYIKQIENNFNILDLFKDKVEEIGVMMTLSVGIGRESKILRELDEMAFSAIGLAYSRGGDQVAVLSQGEDVRYFGGHTENVETSNRVRSRVVGQTLSTLIKQANSVVIMGHKESDFDSFGASLAVMAMCRAYEKKSFIVVDLDSCEEKTKCVVEEMKGDLKYQDCFIYPNSSNEIDYKKSLLVIVDNHKPSLALDKELLHKIKNKVVIDHHRRGTEFIDLPILTYLEPGSSSTIEMVVDLFSYQKSTISISEREATIMYAGLIVDTNNFKTRVGPRTFEIAAYLRREHANVAKAHRYLEDDYQATKDKLSITEASYKFGEDILIAYGNEDKFYSRTILAKAANELITVAGIKAGFSISYCGKGELCISARSTRDVNVQLIMEKLGGGGHFTMAACQLGDISIVEAVNRLETAINEYLDERVSE